MRQCSTTGRAVLVQEPVWLPAGMGGLAPTVTSLLAGTAVAPVDWPGEQRSPLSLLDPDEALEPLVV